MTENTLRLARDLRHLLHTHPELSNQEVWTKQTVMAFLKEHTALDSYPMPFLILQGEEDAFIPMSDILNLRRINEKSKLVVIPGASHRFLESGAWDMVLDLTRDWFEFEQVLLSDWS